MNKPAVFFVFCFVLLASLHPISALETVDSYSATDLKVNWGYLIEELLVDKLYSHGCLHVSPQAVRILYEIIPKGTAVEIKEYSDAPPGSTGKIPHLLDCITSAATLAQARRALARPDNEKLVAYPGQGRLFIYYQNEPYCWLDFRPGFPRTAQMYLGHRQGRPVFDKYYLTRTVPGNFKTSFYTRHLKASYYPLTTTIPYGARLRRTNSGWIYKNNDREMPVPREIAQDLRLPPEERQYEYFDEKRDQDGRLTSVKWGNHDYGIYVIGFSDDQDILNQDLIYAPGLLINIQRRLVNDLVSLITAQSDNLVKLVQDLPDLRQDLLFYNYNKNPVASKYIKKTQEEKEYYAYYKLFRDLALDNWEKADVRPHFFAALKYLNKGPDHLTKEETRSLIDLGAASRQNDRVLYDEKKIQGLYYNLEEIGNQVINGARRWEILKKNWPILLAYRKQARARFGKDNPKLGKYILDEINSHLDLENLY